MNAKQHDSSPLQRLPALRRELQVVLIERQQDSAFAFRNLEQFLVWQAGMISQPRNYVMAFSPEFNQQLFWKVFSSPRRRINQNRVVFNLAGELTCVTKAGEDIAVRQNRVIIFNQLFFGDSGRQQFEYQLDSQTSTLDLRLSADDLRVPIDPIRPVHHA